MATGDEVVVQGMSKVNGNKRPKRNRSILGQNFLFSPQVIDDIHIKAELGRYRMRGMAIFKKIPSWDDLTFLPGTLTRFVIEGYREKCETKTIIGPRAKRPLVLDIPIYITGMSFGALSYESKVALARGATLAGTATCSGEGGMLPDERRYSEKWLYQCIQSRYGFNPHHLRLADACEIFIGQGCKVGLGGHLMGQKVTDQVAEMRSLPAGIDQRSPARHPDWLGPDDLALKIQEVREATNWEIPIQLKLGAARVYDDVRMAVKCNKEIEGINDFPNGVGREAGHCHPCHTRRWPVGGSNQDPVLPSPLEPDKAAERVYNFLHTLTMEAQMLARACGKTNIHSLEPEDLAALTMEASAMCKVPLAGTNYTVGMEPNGYHKY